MRNRKSILLLLSLCSLLILSLFPINSKGATDIPYTFDDDVLFSSTELGRQSRFDNSSKTFNVRERQEITGHFNATYSFEGETGFPSGWDDALMGVGSTAVINDTFSEHDEVLNCTSAGGGSLYRPFQQFIAQSDGTFEFWIASPDTSKTHSVYLTKTTSLGGVNIALFIQIVGGNVNIVHGDGGGGATAVDTGSIANNVWTQVSITFDTATDTFSGFRNGIEYVTNENFFNDNVFGPNDLDTITLFGPNSLDTLYFDALGYSWDTDYNSGDNLVPYVRNYSVSEGQYEVDAWEFDHNPLTRTRYVDGFDDPSGWEDFGDAEPVSDNVNVLNLGFSPGGPEFSQRYTVVHINDANAVKGLFRNFNGINDSYYNITYNFQINELSGAGTNNVILSLRDSDDASWIALVYLRQTAVVEVFHDGGSTVLGAFDTTNNYTASFFINFPSQIFNFSLINWNDGSLLYSFTGGFFDDTADDLDRVMFQHTDTDSGVDTYLFSVSIYNTTQSISDDVGELEYDEVASPVISGGTNWLFNEYNLINLYGDFENASVFINELGGIVDFLFIDWTDIDTNVFTNIYDETRHIDAFFSDVKVWMNYNFTFDEISFSGVKLIEGSDEHILEFTFGSVDGNESYFYVDGSNRLQFRHVADDSNLEFIQASFNVNDVSSDESAIAFRSVISDRAFGFFRVSFSTVSNFFPLLGTEGNSKVILSQGLIIREYIVLITDNDDNITGLTTGFVSNVELIFITNIDVNIITTSLINIMIPLIMIIIPTLGLSARVGKSAIVPIFLLMSLLLVVTEVIPVWLFFVIGVSSALFIFIKRREVLF